ncbi:HEAT repeat domain-containing protein, partial [Providencia stuartii]|nr:HEAT repeat domain-containing protein [Providencia stuartii]
MDLKVSYMENNIIHTLVELTNRGNDDV